MGWKIYGPGVKFYSVSGMKNANLVLRDNVVVKDGEPLFELPGVPTFEENVLMAIAIALTWGVEKDIIVEEIKRFRGLPHRLEEFLRVDGVTFVNDSKSTNPVSLLKALSKYPPQESLLLIGGMSKDEGYEILRGLLSKALHVVFFGRDGEKLKKIIEPPSSEVVGTLREAIERLPHLLKIKKPKYVLFSPACASFDEFGNYKERGDFFKEEVKRLYGKV